MIHELTAIDTVYAKKKTNQHKAFINPHHMKRFHSCASLTSSSKRSETVLVPVEEEPFPLSSSSCQKHLMKG
jgi:hypothetical protein